MSFRGLLVGSSLLVLLLVSTGIAQPPEESPHAAYFAEFDEDGSGVIEGKEIYRLPRKLREMYSRQGANTNPNITLERFHGFMELHKQLLEHDLAQKRAKQDEHKREQAFDDYSRKLVSPEISLEEDPGEPEVTLETSPHAEYFRHFDKDGNGVLEGDEKDLLPQDMRNHFANDFRLAWELDRITIREFHEFWEQEKEGWEQRRERIQEKKRFDDYRATYAKGEDKPEPAVEEAATAEEAPAADKPAPKNQAEASATKSFQVEIVMLRRTSAKLPDRTLASETLSVLDGAGPSLSARLLPWLNDADNGSIQLVDYLQAQSVDGQPIVIQRGGREPYVSSTTAMGGRGLAVSYQMQNVGTLVRVNPVAMKESGELGLNVQFEKSYVEQAKPLPEQPSTEEEPRANEPGHVGIPPVQAGGANIAYVNPSPYAQPGTDTPPPSIATLTAEGMLTLPSGKAGVLTEVAKRLGDEFQEVVILVQWN
ncbi:hypothetical protein AB1K70_02355 [Bremerella sp. JC770]|uniref:hypothetical protein n=1 Tax=Bremerella sp. JC770 TaxID=3232137 RepID=UPI003458CD70